MIDIKTVFILGAGASKPYKFPTAEELKAKILKIDIASAFKAANEPPGETHNLVWKYVFDKCGDDIIFDFISSFKKSGKTSVDAFLEHRREFLDIGKILLSLELIRCEYEDNLFVAENNWYDYIYGKLNSKYEDFERNNISFITFNYDRSLEHYLLTCIKNSYNKTDKEAAQALSSIPIIHLYGTLGYLPVFANGKKGRSYIQACSPEIIATCIDNIKIIHEGIDIEKDEEFKKAYELISDAQMICFLGFGYDEINLSRLKFKDLLTQNHLVLGSTYGFKQAEVNKIKSWFGNNIANREMHADETGKLDCLEYLRSIANFI